ncbi:MAG TPA: phenylacetate--CoA ligase [Burkholderiaceae bacterium]|nr:phenylacetate--CoA ligase [Burkholderiaceae bacterium]
MSSQDREHTGGERSAGGFPLEPIERASVDELRSLQLERLKWSLRHAWERVPHYRQRFDEAGAHPDELKQLDDLHRFPFTTKADLRQTYPFGMFAVPREQVVRLHASSGTTGKPTVVGYTAADIDTWAALVARSIRASGARPGDLVHVSYGYGLFTGGLGAHYGAERLGLTVVPFGGGQTERQVQLMQDFRPDIVMITPSYMLAIADEFERRGIDPRSASMRIGIFGAEPWTNEMRGEIERRLSLDAVDIYGLSEVMGPGVANECIETKDGPTLWEDHFYPEIVDPETGAVLPDGEFGELVLTSLTKQALPVVRYRTRDLTRLLPGTARTMRRIEKITGRSDDMMIVRGVNVFPSQIEELILQRPNLAPHYQCELGREGRLDTLVVRVELKAGEKHDRADRVGAAAALEHAIKAYIGVSARVVVEGPGMIERSQGKARRVVDKRPKGA